MTDLIIIGCGPGGYQTAHHAARKGLQVTIFEDQEVGGTCLNRGCIPTKTFCHVADVIDGVHDAEAYGIDNLGFDINFAKIRDHKNEVVSQLRSGIETLMSAPGITFVRGKASMKDAHTVICNGEEYQARNIIIATGSHAKMPPIEGIHSPNVVTSTELLDIDHIPAHLVIVGAGVIGMEFAAAFSSFGSSVTVIEFLKECLPPVDSDIAKRLRKLLEKRGIKFFLQAGVKRIEGQTVIFEQKGKELRVDGDTILIATGRGANTDGLNLDEVGIQYDRRGICTDEHLETSVKGVYAIGDVNGKMMLAHAAEFQGYHVINHLLGEEDAIRLDIMPSAVFTNPEVAGVGRTEDQCKADGLAYESHKGFYRANGKALAMNVTDGIVKILTDSEKRIIGCHILGAHASDIVQEATALMNHGATLDDLRAIIHTHPTLGEILLDAAER